MVCFSAQAAKRMVAVGVITFALASLMHAKSQAADSTLVDVQSLKAMQQDGRVVLVDVRAKSAFDEGRVEGARWADVDEWKTKSLSEDGLVKPDYWETEFGNLGIDKDTSVVVICDSVTNGARAWWLLRYWGIESVRLLDGGVSAWKAAGGELTTHKADYELTKPKLQANEKQLADLKELQLMQETSSYTVIDTRSDAEYKGERVSGPRGGHIPGAVNLEWTVFVDEDGKFKSKDAIREVLDSAGIKQGSTMVTHCQTGARASVVVLALELVGFESVKNYYRGWSEYSGSDAKVEK